MIIILFIYVDDALFMGSNKAQLFDHKKKFMKQWESCDLGEAKEYLGIRITRDCKAHTITLDQTHYVEKVATCFGWENCKEVSIPLSAGYCPRPNEGNTNPTFWSHYQSVIGSLLYIVTFLPTCLCLLFRTIFLLIDNLSLITNCPPSSYDYSPTSSLWLLPHSLSSQAHHLMTHSRLLYFILSSSMTFYLVIQLGTPEPTLNQGVRYIRSLDEDLHL